MCLITRQKQPKILKKDLIVYKVLEIGYSNRSIRSPYKTHHFWEINKLYTTNLLYHKFLKQFDTFADNIAYLRYWKKSQLITIEDGFHSYMTLKRLYDEEMTHNYRYILKVGKMLIPKGSEIFYDITGLCVSNNIKLLELLDYEKS